MTIVTIYVDDILITGSIINDIGTLKQHLHSTFGIKDLGHLHYFLGFKVIYLMASHYPSENLHMIC